MSGLTFGGMMAYDYPLPVTLEFIMSRVKKTKTCWLWQGAKSDVGYGNLGRNGKTYLVHILAWQYYHGPMEDGKEVCHTCDTPNCIRPDHLFAGTHKENIQDAVSKGKRFGFLSRPELIMRGEKNVNSKLTKSQVIEIREKYALGNISRRKLAEAYGVDKSNVDQILSHKIWKHV